MVDRSCPQCGQEAVAVLDVQSIGTRGDTVRHGTAHFQPGGPGGWRIYVHADGDGDD